MFHNSNILFCLCDMSLLFCAMYVSLYKCLIVIGKLFEVANK